LSYEVLLMKSTCTYPCYRTNKKLPSRAGKKRKNLKLVFFDMDGVLLDTVSSWRYVHEYFGTTNERSIMPYLRGDIDYLEFIRRDVSLWKTNGKLVKKTTIQKILYSIPFIKGGRILDIGCGNGTELYKLKAMGWDTYGVEMDGQASERARSKGISVYTGDLFGAAYPDHFFHVVRMSFVLEHLPNPRETLQEIRRILVSKGRIYISIQNARSLHYWLFGQRWFSLDVPRHLFTFTPKTIKRLLSSLDLEPKTIWFESGTRSFLASLQYIVNDRYQRGGGYTASQSVVKSRFLRTLSYPICWIADQMGWGDLMYLEVVNP